MKRGKTMFNRIKTGTIIQHGIIHIQEVQGDGGKMTRGLKPFPGLEACNLLTSTITLAEIKLFKEK